MARQAREFDDHRKFDSTEGYGKNIYIFFYKGMVRKYAKGGLGVYTLKIDFFPAPLFGAESFSGPPLFRAFFIALQFLCPPSIRRLWCENFCCSLNTPSLAHFLIIP